MMPGMKLSDPDNWVKIARLSVGASAALIVVTIGILLFVKPPNQCPYWHGLWELVIFWGIPVTIAPSFIVIRWNWFARRMTEKPEGLFFAPRAAPPVPVTFIMTCMCVAGALVSQLPQFLLITQCVR